MDLMLKWRLPLLRGFTFILTVAGLILLGGCEASEEATEEESGEEQLMEEGEPAEEEEESADQQALTSFIGAAPKATAAPAPEPKKEEPVMPPPQPAVDYQAQIDELRTENTSLKQKIVKLEQDNRSLMARLSDTEAKLMAEKERADKAVEAAKTTMVTTRGAAVTAPAPATTMVKPVSGGAYDSGLQMFKSKNYDGVISTMQGLLDGGAPENLQDNCHYWLGEAYYAKRQYAEAIKHFQKVFDYAKSEKKADAQYMIAQSYDRMGNKAKAKAEYEKLVKDYPTSGKVARAKERWAKL
ncbi:MAG TPA: tetratricopeptide repeat protein [Bacteroidota bacterium]|nr:tetratricopeptide repeat protein [Bacteroidota bacterium]